MPSVRAFAFLGLLLLASVQAGGIGLVQPANWSPGNAVQAPVTLAAADAATTVLHGVDVESANVPSSPSIALAGFDRVTGVWSARLVLSAHAGISTGEVVQLQLGDGADPLTVSSNAAAGSASAWTTIYLGTQVVATTQGCMSCSVDATIELASGATTLAYPIHVTTA